MWYLEAFDKKGDARVYREPLPHVDAQYIREILQVPPDDPMVGDYPLTERAANGLRSLVHRPIVMDHYDYFVGERSDS